MFRTRRLGAVVGCNCGRTVHVFRTSLALPTLRRELAVAERRPFFTNGPANTNYLKTSSLQLDVESAGATTAAERTRRTADTVGVLERLYNRIFQRGCAIPVHILKYSGYFLATKCSSGVDISRFFKDFDLPDTFYSWWLVTELHAWMLSLRLMVGGTREGQVVRNFMVESLWDDCEGRAKTIAELSRSDRSKYVWDIAEEFQAALIFYDIGSVGSDIDLGNALLRRFFLADEATDPQKIELLVQYVRASLSKLDTIALDDLLKIPSGGALHVWVDMDNLRDSK